MSIVAPGAGMATQGDHESVLGRKKAPQQSGRGQPVGYTDDYQYIRNLITDGMLYKTKRWALAARPNGYSATIEPCGARTLFFIYYIVPAGGDERDALVQGNLMTTSVAAATQYVQGVTAPNVQGRSGLEVILQDGQGNEIFRCRHRSSA